LLDAIASRGVRWRGRQQRRRLGYKRSFQLHVKISSQLYLGLRGAAAAGGLTVSALVEEALWKFLSELASKSGAQVFERLRHANSLIQEVVALAHKTPLMAEKDAENIHETDPRQRRRNQLSEKSSAAFEQVYDLCQSERLAGENRMRAAMYAVLARLAAVNEIILQGASEEEVLKEIRRLNEERERFEEHTRKLETAAQENAGATGTSPATTQT
jgi:hypothetical protein